MSSMARLFGALFNGGNNSVTCMLSAAASLGDVFGAAAVVAAVTGLELRRWRLRTGSFRVLALRIGADLQSIDASQYYHYRIQHNTARRR